jgi:hypothetical protein
MKARASLYVNPNLEIIPSRLARVIGLALAVLSAIALNFAFCQSQITTRGETINGEGPW